MPQNPTMKLSAEDLQALRWAVGRARSNTSDIGWTDMGVVEHHRRCDAAAAVVDRLAAASEPEPEMEARPFDRMHLRDLQSQVDGLESHVDRRLSIIGERLDDLTAAILDTQKSVTALRVDVDGATDSLSRRIWWAEDLLGRDLVDADGLNAFERLKRRVDDLGAWREAHLERHRESAL